MNVDLAYTPDQNYQSSFAAEFFVSFLNARLFNLFAYNKSASDYWLEIYDHQFKASGTPMELPLAAGSYLDFTYPNGKQYGNGIYVRVVASQGGAIITSNNVKLSAAYMTGPLTQQIEQPMNIYRALLTQSGTSAPVATVLENTFGAPLVWSYANVGDYNVTLAAAFPNANTFARGGPGILTLKQSVMSRTDANVVNLKTYSNITGPAANDLLTASPVEIVQYP
jgi:hypothetical protein